MNLLTSHGKIPRWYNKYSKYYDAFNEGFGVETINRAVEKILRKHRVKAVLDNACGTGFQVFWLAKCGYSVIGSDINPGMLKIAREKAKKGKVNVRFLKGDMRTIKVGSFDAVITIYNAIGHLTKGGFEKALRNIYKNLNFGGIYVFDILNLNQIMNESITNQTVDYVRTMGDIKLREIEYSVINKDGIMISYVTNYIQKGTGKPRISKYIETLQLYTAKELKQMLTKNGFKVLGQYGKDGSKFSERKTRSILTVAKKQ